MDEQKQMILDYVINEYLEEDDDQEIDLDTELISGGIVDSFSMVSLKRFLEKKYDIQIPDADGNFAWASGEITAMFVEVNSPQAPGVALVATGAIGSYFHRRTGGL